MKQANKSHDATAKGFFIVMEFLFILLQVVFHPTYLAIFSSI